MSHVLAQIVVYCVMFQHLTRSQWSCRLSCIIHHLLLHVLAISIVEHQVHVVNGMSQWEWTYVKGPTPITYGRNMSIGPIGVEVNIYYSNFLC